ncbi:putative ergosterol biosynthesis protein Erg28 [Talaromyces proteolyticus]|uniref:Ergosterol biosynthesis protein Erg28 n=1 Tax=Talaromyces proteolyticus TaxID=1131652 RepID=A0AAD4KMK0_9EURO|nr:putative ergosterol biosynthesis protein Erg28 [Talaromyces proteolyticus]KAH8691455.1 putative ergosterol biosynthesis protein Erg28 [Talaromyces proteolyticus]
MTSIIPQSLLPPTNQGWLPPWLLLVSVISTANSVQSYLSTEYHAHLFIGSSSTNNQSPSTPLASRTFGTWTLLSSVIRAYAAYNIHNSVAYDLATWTYGIALAHFVSEWAIYGTAQVRGRFVMPLIFASSALVWMASQRAAYLG